MPQLACISVSLPNCEKKTINISSKETRETQPEDDLLHEYCGRHDHGDCSTLKNGGHYSVLLKSLRLIKSECDRYLTEEIKLEASHTLQAAKRAKIDT